MYTGDWVQLLRGNFKGIFYTRVCKRWLIKVIHKICSTSEFAYKNSITRQSEWARGWDSLGDRIDHGVGFFRVQNGHGITIAQWHNLYFRCRVYWYQYFDFLFIRCRNYKMKMTSWREKSTSWWSQSPKTSASREAALIPRPAKSSWVRRFLGLQGSRPGEGHWFCGRRGYKCSDWCCASIILT